MGSWVHTQKTFHDSYVMDTISNTQEKKQGPTSKEINLKENNKAIIKIFLLEIKSRVLCQKKITAWSRIISG